MNLPPLRDPHLNYRYRRRLHVVRVLLALSVTFAIISLFELPHSGWALVSTVMVMGNLPHVGGVLDKGRQRLLGSLLGAGWGLLLILVPLSPTLVIPLGALIGIGAATWLTFGSRHGYSGLMFAISLLLVIGAGNQELDVALWRAFDVLLGTLVGIAVTALVLPQKATDMMRFLLADNLERLARLYQAHTESTHAPDVDTQRLLKAASKLLVKQRNLVDAIHRERRLRRDELDELISLQRRMLSTIELLLETHWTTRAGHERIAAMVGLREEQFRLASELDTLAYQVRTGQPIDVAISPFDLQRHAELACNARSEDGRVLFSPSGYLWLNRELARLAQALVSQLGSLERLPSRRLRRASGRSRFIADRTEPVQGEQENERQP
ncbi:FUSC family protein [Billgrantia gudaonensis]|uniref:Fusaric acid resistance protein family protein n=1 Tax=Billgrantia gudaonensis TaxID=376427 RepID=A0A1G8T6D5_9GAMM|nr:FUSC family protein [Halomonas gudaonensis]SDJ36964.1 Fusaric acid resistance protein family protein [Halomonas gudaonensis]